MRKKTVAFILLGIMLIALGMTFKRPIPQSISGFLMKQDPLEKADLLVVLSGGSYDRGNEASKVYKAGYAPLVLCPGGNLLRDFLIIGDTTYESDLTKAGMVKNGVSSDAITVLRYGTSTAEESDTVLGYCREHHIRKIIVVSNLFHLRRAGKVYRKKFAGDNITILMHGAHDSQYDEEHWWENEYGLIALNNEFMKTLYYLIKRK